ncbi:MAG: DNA mismatch repair protein MutS [Candidatus Mycalebacterium zealandia]|nr:MAG: DNA mismatch repair protein MutS [Candidatus Mycalebacterium zealandia]
MSESSTPMLEQYKSIKSRYHDSILFFRLGDFYEMFFEDALAASEILGITLTARNKKSASPVPFCGVPFHSAERYVSKLLEFGLKVAICEQVEEGQSGKLVERRVVKVLTPGTVLGDESLDSKTNNYIASVSSDSSGYHLAHCDISTGDFAVCSLKTEVAARSELLKLMPSEVVIAVENGLCAAESAVSWNPLFTIRQDLFVSSEPGSAVMKHFGISSLAACGFDETSGAALACSALLEYMRETQMDYMPSIKLPVLYGASSCVQIDESTRKNLELVKSMTSEDGPTLIKTIDLTLTPMGGRLLRKWMDYPLTQIDEIESRLDAVENLCADSDLTDSIRTELKGVNDIERLIGRISTPSSKPRDMTALKDSLLRTSELKKIAPRAAAPLLRGAGEKIDGFDSVTGRIAATIYDEPPATLAEGGVIKEGCDPDLDEFRRLRQEGRNWISGFEQQQREKTGISSLKVGYNRVFGYYVEVTKTNIDKVPPQYVRKQTLSSSERFTTPELSEWEEKIKIAEDEMLRLEREIFEGLRREVSSVADKIRECARLIAVFDVLSCFCAVAVRNGYTRPVINGGGEIDITDGRHPVVEQIRGAGAFVANNVKMDDGENRFLLITGPNMAGKSTLIRQVALTVLMAQMGSFVPCSKAVVGITDKIFTRVGASDNLAKGLSTFMSEMVETAYIIRNCTPRSLVILDEIGRGTGTFDGMSIAWAVAEHLHQVGARSLFATHYHELANLSASNPGVKNYNVAVKKSGEEIVFLKKLVPGSSSHSYGIQVAALAGVPESVLVSARKILSSLESMRAKMTELMGAEQMTLFPDAEPEQPAENSSFGKLAEDLSRIDTMNLTPAEAIKTIEELKKKLETD